MRLEDHEWPVEAGDVYTVAPGEIGDLSGLREAEGWGRGCGGRSPASEGAPEERSSWSERFSALELELRRRQDGYREAVLAHLTLLLVSVGRLASDVVRDLRLKDEPLLAEVFRFIEERYGESISLEDVARAVSLTPGHLTTVVRRKTGRTVVEWISERRIVEARRLLVETNHSVEKSEVNAATRIPRTS